MAYLDFGFGTGLAYKYDFNERYRRKRQSSQDKLEQQRYDDKIAYQEERNDIADERYDEEQTHERDKEASAAAINQAELYYKDIPETASRWNTKRQDYTQPLLQKIGEIENTPGYNSDPKLMADLQKYRREAATMSGEPELKSASEDYAKMVEAYKNDDIDSKEYAEEIKKWKDYNERVGEYTENSKNHYSYIPKEKFSIHNSITDFLGEGDYTNQYVYAAENGQFRSVTQMRESGDMEKLIGQYMSKNKESATNDFNGLSEGTQNLFGSGESGVKKYVEWNFETALGIGKSKKASQDQGIDTDYWKETFDGKTAGKTKHLSDMLNVSSGNKLNIGQLYGMKLNKDGILEQPDLPLDLFPNIKINISGNSGNITNWKTDDAGQRYAEVPVVMTYRDYLKTVNSLPSDVGAADYFSNINFIKTGDYSKFKILDEEEGEEPSVRNVDEPERFVSFTTYVPLNTTGISKFNKSMDSSRAYDNTPKTEIIESNDETKVEKETKEETEGTIDTSKYNTE